MAKTSVCICQEELQCGLAKSIAEEKKTFYDHHMIVTGQKEEKAK